MAAGLVRHVVGFDALVTSELLAYYRYARARENEREREREREILLAYYWLIL